MSNKNYVTYKEFGAVGDGVAEDFPAIVRAHEYANENGLSVRADDGATYYVGVIEKSAIIKTDTDWGNAKFIVDDRIIRIKDDEGNLLRNHQVSLFKIEPDTPAKTLNVPEGLSLDKGATKINMTFDKPCMIKVENENHRENIRYGINEDKGNPRLEMLIVDKDGNISEETEVQHDYEAVTKITAYSINEKPITVRGGVFYTMMNNPHKFDEGYINSYYYFARNMICSRSNTTVEAVGHYSKYDVCGDILDLYEYLDRVPFEERYGAPYRGFFCFFNNYNVTFKNCVCTGTYEYGFINQNGRVNKMGSYEFWGNCCVKWVIDGVRQSNKITDPDNQHGVMGSYFCRNIEMKNCHVDRFDSHKGLWNAYIHDCTIGWSIHAVGGGTLHVENVHQFNRSWFIGLRADYGSHFDGDVIIKNCSTSYEGDTSILNATWAHWDFGRPCLFAKSVTVENYRCFGSGKNVVFRLGGTNNKTKEELLADELNPLHLPEKITFINTPELPLSFERPELFDDVKIEVI